MDSGEPQKGTRHRTRGLSVLFERSRLGPPLGSGPEKERQTWSD